jgi:hypothetical protein
VRPALAESLAAYGWRGSLALVVVVVVVVVLVLVVVLVVVVVVVVLGVVLVVVVVGKQDLGLHYFFMIKRETFSRTTRIYMLLLSRTHRPPVPDRLPTTRSSAEFSSFNRVFCLFRVSI